MFSPLLFLILKVDVCHMRMQAVLHPARCVIFPSDGSNEADEASGDESVR